MNLSNILKEKIKPELNKIYTEHPKFPDWGWFCREHAFHTHFVCRMLGFNSSIKSGDFTAMKHRQPMEHFNCITSFGDDYNHSWCQVENIAPIDLSVNFEYMPEFPWVDIVFGTQHLRKYILKYIYDEELYNNLFEDRTNLPILLYLERETLCLSDDELLNTPYAFIHKPQRNGWCHIYGNDIFNKITMHIYKIAIAEIDRITICGRNQQTMIKTICGKYQNTTTDIANIIHSNQNKPIYDLF